MNKNFQLELQKAIDIREKGELARSRKLFETLISDIRIQHNRHPTEELNKLYVNVMGEYVIQYRLEAKSLYAKALGMGLDLIEFDNKKNLNEPLSYRSVSNVLIDLGNYEKAIEYLKKVASLYTGNSSRYGDTLSHLAYCYFRSGRVEEAKELIEKAILEINKNTKKERYMPVWLSHAYMVEAYILYARRDKAKSLGVARKALNIAKRNKLPFRVKQAEELVKFLGVKRKK